MIPIVLITFLFGIFRHYVAMLMSSPKKLDRIQITESQALLRSRRLRANGQYITREGFMSRKAFYCAEKTGFFHDKRREVPAANPMTDPTMMQDMMKGQVLNAVPMLLIGAVISWVFSGFVTLKVPFPLTTQFKPMLQRGVDLTTLGSSWVSSMSFYFLCMFGLRSVYSLILGAENSADQSAAMKQQMTMGMGGPIADPGKAFDGEREALEVTDHHWALQL